MWDNRPETVHPAMREAGCLRSYESGWLVFESADGRARLRLTPVPAEWPDASESVLREWLARASRTFRFPGGRYWTVTECALPERRTGPRAGVRRVLRFTAGTRSLDGDIWPRDWNRYSEEELATLLATSFPRARGAVDGAPRRRASDGARRA